MATLKTCNKKGKYHDLTARETVVRYINNPYKTIHGFCGGVHVTENDIADSMEKVAQQFGKTNGVKLRHFVLSFTPDEIDKPEIANAIACQIAMFIGREYQVAFAVHENTENLHIHLVFNSISYVDGHRYYGKKKEYYDLVNFVKHQLYHNYGLYLVTVSALSEVDIQGQAIN